VGFQSIAGVVVDFNPLQIIIAAVVVEFHPMQIIHFRLDGSKKIGRAAGSLFCAFGFYRSD
jgi:hypothetical protein